MSAEHKRPLYAFGAVMVVCVMIIAHAVHSQALTRFLGPTSPMIVAAGPHFIQAPAAVTDQPPVLPAEPELPRGVADVQAPGAVIRQSSVRDRRARGAAPKTTVSLVAELGKPAAPGKKSAPGRSASAPGHAHSAAATGTPPGKARAAGARGRSAGHGKSRGAAPGRGATKNRSRTTPARGQGAKRPARAVKRGPSARGPRGSGRHGRR